MHSFSTQAEALLTLPRCANILPDFEPGHAYNNEQIRDIYVGWVALTSQAAHIRVVLRSAERLCVVGDKKSAPEHLQRPWQLVVCGGVGVPGLPIFQPTDEAYL